LYYVIPILLSTQLLHITLFADYSIQNTLVTADPYIIEIITRRSNFRRDVLKREQAHYVTEVRTIKLSPIYLVYLVNIIIAFSSKLYKKQGTLYKVYENK